MSTAITHNDKQPQRELVGVGKRDYSEFIMVAIMGVVSAILIIGSLNMATSEDGPFSAKTTPLIVGIALAVVTALLAVDILRNTRMQVLAVDGNVYEMSSDMLHDLAGMDEADDKLLNAAAFELDDAITTSTDEEAAVEVARVTDYRTLLLLVAATLLFVLLLPYLGWVICAAALFWSTARLLGSTRPVMDIWTSLIVASVIQLAFGGLLGLHLPAGFFGGL